MCPAGVHVQQGEPKQQQKWTTEGKTLSKSSAFAVGACTLKTCQGAVTNARRPGIDIELVGIDFEV